MKQQQKRKAFTLVELIVVITILAILGTIAFISFQGYSKEARDSVRLSDINNIKKSLELFSLQTGKYPMSDNFETVTYQGDDVWHQGVVGDNVTSNLQKLNEKPTDPLFNTEYIYSVTDTRKEYEVLALYEGDNIVSNMLIAQTYAADNLYPKIDGTYNQIYVKTKNYIVPTPSIITSELLPYSLTGSTIDSQVVTGGSNIPSIGLYESQTGGLIINLTATGIIDSNSTDEEKVSVMQAIQAAYSGTSISNQTIYAYLLSQTTNEELLNLANITVLNGVISNTTESGGGQESIVVTPYELTWDGHSANDYLRGVEVDNDGNIFLAGFTRNGAYDNFYVRKLNNSGIELWLQEWDGNGLYDQLYGIKLDDNGNIYVVGATYISTSNTKFYVRKIDNSGIEVWSQEWVSNVYVDTINGVTIDSNGFLYVAGYTKPSLTNIADYYVRKMNTSDGTEVWSQAWGGSTTTDYLTGIRVDNNGNIFVVGYTAGAYWQFYVRKMNSSGVEISSNTFTPHNLSSFLYGMEIDDNGNIYVAGGATVSGSNSDFYVRKFNNDLSIGWTQEWDGGDLLADFINGISLDNDGNIYIAGYTNLLNGYEDFYVRKMDNFGNEIWSQNWDGGYGRDDRLYGIKTDRSGNVYVAGYTNNGTNNDFYLRVMDSNGN